MTKATTRQFITILSLLILPACFGSNKSSSSDEADAGSTTTDFVGETFNDTEAELYSDGPVDIPVPIARATAMDLSKMTATYQDAGIDSSGSLLTRYTTGSSGYIITGSAGASPSNKVYFFNIQTQEALVVLANEDGSFEGKIVAREGDLVAVSALNDAEDTASPPITIATNKAGLMEAAFTNSNSIGTEANLIAASDYTFIALQNNDGTSSLIRRKFNSSNISTVAKNVSGSVKAIGVDQGIHDVSLIMNDELLYRIDNANTSVELADTSWNNPLPIYTVTSDIRDFDLIAGLEAFMDSNNNILICQIDSFDSPDYNNAQMALIHISSTGTETVLANDKTHIIIDCDQADNGNVYVLARAVKAGGELDAPTIFRLAIADGVNSLTNAQVYRILSVGIGVPLALDMSPDTNYALISSINSAGDFVYVVYEKTTALETTIYNHALDSDRYTNFARISSTGVVVACSFTDEENNHFVAHRFKTDGVDTFTQLTDPKFSLPCNGTFDIGRANHLIYYRSPGTSITDQNSALAAPQVSMINLDLVDFDALAPDN